MATFYVDFDNGNDNYAGTSFDPISGTDGRISGSTFTSASANFTSSLSSLYNYGDQYLSIFNGTNYSTYAITAILGPTSLGIVAISGGTALANQTVDRQYYIGGRWKTFANGASAARIQPGDTINVMASPDPTIIGTATWNPGNLPSTISVSSSTNASPISVTANNHGYATGDTVIITGHTTNTNANGTWEITVTGANTFTLNGSTGNGTGGASGTVRNRNNCVVRLSSPVTQNIASCGNRGQGRVAWTTADVTNVTASLNTTDFKEGDCSDSIAIGVNFTTGKAAYFPTGNLNLSGYQQVSFWIKQTAGTVAVIGDLSLNLCSDTLGNTVVNTISIESLVSLNTWLIATVNLGSNLGSSIQSISLNINVDRGAQTFLLSNIIACKAQSSPDSLNIASLIGPEYYGQAYVANWYGIQSINGTRIMIDGLVASTPITPPRGVTTGSFGSINTYKRETVKVPIATNINGLVLNEAGTSSNNIFIQGGFDRTNMTSSVSQTVLDGRIGTGTAITNSRAYINVIGNSFSFVRFNIGIEAGSFSFYAIDQINHCSTAMQGSAVTNSYVALSNAMLNSNVIGTYASNNTFYITNVESNTTIINALRTNNQYNFSGSYNSGTAVNMANNPLGNNVFTNVYSYDTVGFFNGIGANNYAYNCYFASNIDCTSGDLYLYNTNLGGASPALMSNAFSNARIYSHNDGGIANYHVIYTDGGRINTSTSVTKNNSGISWALAPTSTNRSASYPLYLKIATAAVSASSTVTISAWMRRSNIGLTMSLAAVSLLGHVQNNINISSGTTSSSMTAQADIWEQVSISFVPSVDQVVDIVVNTYGGTTFTGYVDELTITQ